MKGWSAPPFARSPIPNRLTERGSSARSFPFLYQGYIMSAKEIKRKITAYGDTVVIQPSDAPTVTSGGLVLPDSVGSKWKNRGIIISSNLDDLKKGDEILFKTGFPIPGIDKQLIVVEKDQILVLFV